MAGVLNSTTGFTKSVTSQSLVTLTGALGQQGTSSYTGENHVDGPMMGGTPRPLTLGDTNGSSSPNTDTSKWDASTPTLTNSTDGFLKNCTAVDSATNNSTSSTGCYVSSGTNASSPDMFLDLSNIKYQGHAVEVASFSFDFEIFPTARVAPIPTPLVAVRRVRTATAPISLISKFGPVTMGLVLRSRHGSG